MLALVSSHGHLILAGLVFLGLVAFVFWFVVKR